MDIEEATEAGDMEFEFISNKGQIDKTMLESAMITQMKKAVTVFTSQ